MITKIKVMTLLSIGVFYINIYAEPIPIKYKIFPDSENDISYQIAIKSEFNQIEENELEIIQKSSYYIQFLYLKNALKAAINNNIKGLPLKDIFVENNLNKSMNELLKLIIQTEKINIDQINKFIIPNYTFAINSYILAVSFGLQNPELEEKIEYLLNLKLQMNIEFFKSRSKLFKSIKIDDQIKKMKTVQEKVHYILINSCNMHPKYILSRLLNLEKSDEYISEYFAEKINNEIPYCKGKQNVMIIFLIMKNKLHLLNIDDNLKNLYQNNFNKINKGKEKFIYSEDFFYLSISNSLRRIKSGYTPFGPGDHISF